MEIRELTETDLGTIAGGDGESDDTVQSQVDALQNWMSDPANRPSQ